MEQFTAESLAWRGGSSLTPQLIFAVDGWCVVDRTLPPGVSVCLNKPPASARWSSSSSASSLRLWWKAKTSKDALKQEDSRPTVSITFSAPASTPPPNLCPVFKKKVYARNNPLKTRAYIKMTREGTFLIHFK